MIKKINMRENLEKKSLIVVNEKSLFYNIKTFILRLFRGKEIIENKHQIVNEENNEIQSNNKQNDTFLESIRNIEDEEINLLKLQEQFDKGKIDKSQLSNEQVVNLIVLYKKQISKLTKSNARRKEKLLQYRNKMQNA